MSSVSESTPWQNSAACLSDGQLTDLFFENEEALATIYECRKICADCPVFNECLAWSTSTAGFKYLPVGITAGFPSSSRKMFALGLAEPIDWRETWDAESYEIVGLIDATKRPSCTTRHDPVDTGDGLTCRKCGYPVKYISRR